VSLIRIVELNKTFGNGIKALQSVSLEIEAGSFVVVLGPSGAGKSTLLRCINRLEIPGSGTVSVAGEELNAANVRRVRSQVGMVFQQFNLVGRLNVMTNVLTGRLSHLSVFEGIASLGYLFGKTDCQIAREALERVGLAARAWDRADRLSGGEQQRVGIARALAQRPRVMLADEPVASLDPVTGDGIMNLLKEICVTDKLTVIVNLHQVSLARRFADRIVGMNSGRIVFDGSPRDLNSDALKTIYGEAIEHEYGVSAAEHSLPAGRLMAASPIPISLAQRVL
jgi:phosphonate transport system ATP-binding protein